ncbi:DNA-protecting protein DprA [bacterium]|nr:MAG: DNA-protecting protein DprA [bacterium]
MLSDIKYLNAFNQFELIGSQTLKKIKKYFRTYQKAWEAPAFSFTKAGLKGKIIEELSKERAKINPDEELKKLEKYGVKILTPTDKKYPCLLKEIYDFPQILYYLGDINAFSKFSLAIVGSRKYTSYGKEIVEYFSRELAEMQLTIVSGLALGIDALAHKAAVDAGGKTIAVLGCGLNYIYPPTNRKLAKEILRSGGLILSEYPLGSGPLRHHFPHRNRIISGLSLGVLVIEAAERSGSLLTANCALEQNREVFAIPGNIFSLKSAGCHQLIKSGAKLVNKPQDILTELEIKNIKEYKETKKVVPESKEEEIVLNLLKEVPREINHIIKKLNLPVSQVNSLLTIMEMKGKIKNLGNGLYSLKR